MRLLLSFAAYLLIVTVGYAQKPGTAPNDTWENVPPASDDRFTNPKSKLYAGPNGWYNFGEVRAQVSNPAKTTYRYKGGFNRISHSFDVTESGKLQVLDIDFGTDHPTVGTYQVSSRANFAQKKVHLSFSDVSDQKIREWVSTDNGGTVTVSMVNGFMYVKCRMLQLDPAGMHNTGDLKNPMTLGFEGATAPE